MKLCAGPLLFEPGQGWSYGTGLDVVGVLIERANGGIRLGEYFERNIFSPLGLKDFTFSIKKREDLIPRLVPLTETADAGLVDAGVGIADPRMDLGGGGLYASPVECECQLVGSPS